MSLRIKIHKAPNYESVSKFVPRKTPLMPFTEAFDIVKTKYKEAFDYLEDK